LRANREDGEIEQFSIWAPKAIALIGKLHPKREYMLHVHHPEPVHSCTVALNPPELIAIAHRFRKHGNY
jgi:hypothetical protein